MIFQQKEITLKNGTKAILKTPEASDAAGMLAFITKACGETEFLLRYPEEWEGMTVEKEEKCIQNGRDSESTLIIACYIDGDIVGNCEINFRGGIKTGHRAVIAISILKKYWGIGIGSHMFRHLIAAAEAHEDTEIVELEYMQGNERGHSLYEKFGFRIVGERPNAYKLKDGSLRSEILMQKVLNKE